MNHMHAAIDAAGKRVHDYWSEDNKLSTDELRTALRQYRTLFHHVMRSSEIPELEFPDPATADAAGEPGTEPPPANDAAVRPEASAVQSPDATDVESGSSDPVATPTADQPSRAPAAPSGSNPPITRGSAQ